MISEYSERGCIIKYLIGFIVGGWFGIFTMCLMQINKEG